MSIRTLQIRTLIPGIALGLVLFGVALARAPEVVVAKRPNIVVIQTDDQSKLTFRGTFRGQNRQPRLIMPNVVDGIIRSGAEFSNYYTATPVCSPSRASLLTGQYAGNSGLRSNKGPFGGWLGWRNRPISKRNMPVALRRAGYRTAHFGKFLNTYYNTAQNRVDRTVPPGWDRWFTTAFISATPYYGFEVNSDGRPLGPFGTSQYSLRGPGMDPAACRVNTKRAPNGRRCVYLSDVMTRNALREIRDNARRSKRPFYLQIDYQAPHGDARPPGGPTPPTRYLGTASRTPLPRGPAFNEFDVADKPEAVRRVLGQRFGLEGLEQLTRSYRLQVEALRGVDDGVGAILRTLRRTGQLRNTYVFYLTDHGVFQGEHRLRDTKFLPYDPASKVGMAVRGPGIRPGTTVNELSGNIDIPATVLRLAKAAPHYQVDGRPLRRFWRHPGRITRRPYQISMFGKHEKPGGAGVAAAAAATPPAASLLYRGYRVGPYKYIHYLAGGEELYDLRTDPGELRNRIGEPAYAAVENYLRAHLGQVSSCRGATCRAELPPLPQPGD